MEMSTETSTIEQQIEKLAKNGVKAHIKSKDSQAQINELTLEAVTKLGLTPNPIVYEIKTPKGSKEVRDVHFKFPLVMSCIVSRVPTALVGPAGSFKTSTVERIAEHLELPFYSKSVSLQTGIHEFFGYQDANGKYVPTLFRKAYEDGGVFLLDEFDAGNPNVLAALNQATANNSCAFADQMVPKHKDFVIVMAGNTFGHGATIEYVGRNKIDAATLDRFTFIHFPYDEDLEHKLATNKTWFKQVKAYRTRAASNKVNTIISPRATFSGAKLLDAGVSQEEVEEITIFKGLSDKERKLIKGK
jgi:MoxR-like ATPase